MYLQSMIDVARLEPLFQRLLHSSGHKKVSDRTCPNRSRLLCLSWLLSLCARASKLQVEVNFISPKAKAGDTMNQLISHMDYLVLKPKGDTFETTKHFDYDGLYGSTGLLWYSRSQGVMALRPRGLSEASWDVKGLLEGLGKDSSSSPGGTFTFHLLGHVLSGILSDRVGLTYIRHAPRLSLLYWTFQECICLDKKHIFLQYTPRGQNQLLLIYQEYIQLLGENFFSDSCERKAREKEEKEREHVPSWNINKLILVPFTSWARQDSLRISWAKEGRTVPKDAFGRAAPTSELFISVVHDEARGYVMLEEVERRLSWSSGRVVDALETLLKEGLAMIDDGDPDGKRRFWFPCIGSSLSSVVDVETLASKKS
eukprot:Gb_07588 [translate_table: standard]